MSWQQLLSTKRLGAEGKARVDRPGRTEFDSDIDRLIFSSSFRRLGRKTQVHPLAANDHVHSRLTHSLEVSRVGKALGTGLGEALNASTTTRLPGSVTPADLGAVVQAACLAHDLGNPPFGHAGEEAIIHWFQQNHDVFEDIKETDAQNDITRCEGNAQGFRVITQLENNLFLGGLRLTYATLAAFQKYPWTSRLKEKKFGAYISEEAILDRVFTEIGMRKLPDGRWPRHPLAHLVEAADDICYAVIDVEDAVELGILPFSKVRDLLLKPFNETDRNEILATFAPESMHRVNFARMRGPLFDKMVAAAIDEFKRRYDEIMDQKTNEGLFESGRADDPCAHLIKEAKRIGRENIYTDNRKVENEIGCYATLDRLLREVCPAALAQAKILAEGTVDKLPWKESLVLKLLGDHAPSLTNAPEGGWTEHQCLRRAVDFVGGMTDNYAVYVSQQLSGAGFSGGQRP
ncbi:MAG: deoxyguanosinetriphosphate triphosphohydrolase [Hyphomicrobium sp.]|jgi:dGTPase